MLVGSEIFSDSLILKISWSPSAADESVVRSDVDVELVPFGNSTKAGDEGLHSLGEVVMVIMGGLRLLPSCQAWWYSPWQGTFQENRFQCSRHVVVEAPIRWKGIMRDFRQIGRVSPRAKGTCCPKLL